MFAMLLVIEKRWLLKKLEKGRVWNHLYVLFFVLVSFVIFHAANLREAAADLLAMFGFAGLPLLTPECSYYYKSYGMLLLAAAVGSTPLVKNAAQKLPETVRTAAAALLLVLCTAWLIDSSFNPFLYFRF